MDGESTGPEGLSAGATDGELLAAARSGEERAFHQLIDRHSERLFRLAFRLVGTTADAEDVVQETFMGAFEHMEAFEGRATVKTWLTRILTRQAARCHRRRSRKGTMPLEPLKVGFNARPVSLSEDANRRMDVERALQDLSPEHREVVVLREFEGMSYAEMAETLGVPQGTVESRLHRARRNLQHVLREYLP